LKSKLLVESEIMYLPSVLVVGPGFMTTY